MVKAKPIIVCLQTSQRPPELRVSKTTFHPSPDPFFPLVTNLCSHQNHHQRTALLQLHLLAKVFFPPAPRKENLTISYPHTRNVEHPKNSQSISSTLSCYMLAEVPEILLPLCSPKKSTGLMKTVSQHLPKEHGTKIAWDYSMLPYTFSKIEITEFQLGWPTSAEFFCDSSSRNILLLMRWGKEAQKKQNQKKIKCRKSSTLVVSFWQIKYFTS